LFLPTAFCFSIFIVIVVIVELLFLDEIEFDGIQANNLQLDTTLFAINHFALVHVSLHVNVGVAFWARSGRHFCYLQRKFLSGLRILKRVNLTAARQFLQSYLGQFNKRPNLSIEKERLAHRPGRPRRLSLTCFVFANRARCSLPCDTRLRESTFSHGVANPFITVVDLHDTC
jgi:hypothetical protein